MSICNAWLQLPGLGKLSEVSDDGHRWSRLRLAALRECRAWECDYLVRNVCGDQLAPPCHS